MRKWQKINLVTFAIIVIILTSLLYTLGRMNFSSPFGKPWQLLPSVHEDSLSQKYLDDYQILNHKPLVMHFFDSSRVNIFILVDAWGVPLDEMSLEKELNPFAKASHVYALHQRLANRTKHAERVEFRSGPENKLYMFGGDSLEYSRPILVNEIGFKRTLFCQKCDDRAMITKIDSLLENDASQMIAWTTQSSRSGDKDSLLKSLNMIANFAMRHPDVRVVVQGTHRPVLCNSEVRNSYKSHWVPVVILN